MSGTVTVNDLYYEEAWRFWSPPPDAPIVVVGPSSTCGREAIEWARRHNGRVTYIDPNANRVAAVNAVSQDFPNLSASQLDASDEKVSCVVMYGHLNYHHTFEELCEALRKAARRLMPEGLLAIGGTTVLSGRRASRLWGSQIKSFILEATTDEPAELAEPALRYWTYHEQVEALHRAGFEILRWRPIDHRTGVLDGPPSPSLLRRMLDGSHEGWTEETSDAFLLLARLRAHDEIFVDTRDRLDDTAYLAGMRKAYLQHLDPIAWRPQDRVLAVEPAETVEPHLRAKVPGIHVHTVPPRQAHDEVARVDYSHLVLWGACQRLADLDGLLESFAMRGGSVGILMDCVVDESTRDWWSWASWVKDRSTIAHRTYAEYMEARRRAGFLGGEWKPMRHRISVDDWLKKVDGSISSDVERRLLEAPQPIRDALLIDADHRTFCYDTFVYRFHTGRSTS